MNRRTVFSIVAAGSISVAAFAGVSAAAIAATAAVPDDSSRQSTAAHGAPGSQTARATVPAPSASPTAFPAVGGDVARPLEPGDVPVTPAQVLKVIIDNDAQVRAAAPDTAPLTTNQIDDLVLESMLDVKCMAAKGFFYNPIAAPGKLTGRLDPAAFVALEGDTGGGDAYRWQDAGCHGASVHITGNDNAN